MTLKFVIGFALLVVVNASGYLDGTLEEYNPHPQYNFAYDVQDYLTRDSKSHVESRDGDLVRGQYSLLDADGLRRVVDYTADSIHGFNAVVRRLPTAESVPVVTKGVAPIVPVVTTKAVPTPVAPLIKTVAPITAPLSVYGAPLLSRPIHYSAPVTHNVYTGLLPHVPAFSGIFNGPAFRGI